MEFNEYQSFAFSTVVFPEDRAMDYLTNGLAAEAGEVCGKYAKIIRDKNGVVDDQDEAEMAKELGDIMWMVAVMARMLGFTLEDVATMNVVKLQSRKERGVLQGSGDNR